MADGKFLIGKPAGGVTTVSMTDGASNTDLVLPESGTVATIADVNNGVVLLKTIATGTSTFTATTNNINLTGIGIGVEIGDVIQISGAIDAKNNSEFTVEVITDANNIIVNQAHANKGTTKNVANRSGNTGVTVKLLAKWYNASDSLGRDWVTLTTSRVAGTNYVNTTRRGYAIVVQGSNIQNSFGCYITLTINGLTSNYGFLGADAPSGNASTTAAKTVSAGANYMFLLGNMTYGSFQELR